MFLQNIPNFNSHRKKVRGQRLVHEPNVIRMNRTGQGGYEGEKEKGERFHNAAKPVNLVGIFLMHSSDTNHICIDPFLGSGTTMVACQQLDRICYGCEIEPRYCQIVIDRMLKLDPSLEVKITHA